MFLQFQSCLSQGCGTPVQTGGLPDCCSRYVSEGTGVAFAYRAMP